MKTRLVLALLLMPLLSACGGPDRKSVEKTVSDPVEKTIAEQPTPALEKTTATADKNTPAVSPADQPPAEHTAGPGRKWTAPDGRQLAIGEFMDLIGGNVCLVTGSGEGITIPLADLCPADRQYVRSRIPEPPSDPTQPTPAGNPPGAGDPSTENVLVGDPAGPPERSPPTPANGGRKVVIPFDFVSKFDDGRYGSMVGDMIWQKLDREGAFVIPETMLDVRDTCRMNNLAPTPDMPLSEIKTMLEEEFGGQIAIWGSIERATGHDWDVYDLVIKCVDFSAGPEPKVIYQCSDRTETVSEIPHLYVAGMIDAMLGRKPGEPPPPDPIAEKNWQDNPNLVVGDFQRGAAGVPEGWESQGAQPREPLGDKVRWMAESGNPSNRLIRFTFDKGIGDTYGVMYYSRFFPVEEGATYRFQCRWRSNGPAAKVFIKCADEIGTEYRAGGTDPAGRSGMRAGSYVPEVHQTREVYRSQQNLYGPKNTWNVQTEDFTPKHTKYTPRWGRVMLYAYLGAGVVEFDDVVVKQILPAPPDVAENKDPQHSLESDVTIEDMKENQRRSREAREERDQSPGS